MDPLKPKPFLIEVMSGERFEIGSTFTIGRSSSADLVLDSRRVSRQHAMIRCDEKSYTFFDLNSSNGSWVDGREVDQPVALHDGERAPTRRGFLLGQAVDELSAWPYCSRLASRVPGEP